MVAKEIFAKIDHILVGQLKCWAFRRHNKKSKDWVIKKYFKTVNKRAWTFTGIWKEEDTEQVFTLKRLADIPIVRHVKVKKDANPFDPQWFAYFAERSRKAS